MIPPVVKFKKLDDAAQIPDYQHSGDSGMDLRSLYPDLISPGEIAMISTGLSVQLPANFEGQIRPRSGLAAKFGVTVLNSPGTVDFGYTGELKVLLINHSKKDFEIKAGDRIAQFVICPVAQAYILTIDDIEASSRGSGGFGSTGVS
jgi:dUTP pyrophosphatase